MPRRSIRRTDFDTRVRNMLEIEGKHGIGGLSRLGGGMAAVAGVTSSAINDGSDDNESEASSSAHLLCMSVTGDSIASGGDYVGLSSIVAQHGFDTVQPYGGAWTHPVSGVYLLIYTHAWDTYQGGGAIGLELDGTMIPEGLIVDGSSGDRVHGAVAYAAEAGQVGKIKVTQSSGSAQTCDAAVRVAITDPKATSVAQRTDGDAVSLGTQASPDSSLWSGVPAGWEDTSAHWIWHTDLSSGSRPNTEQAWIEGLYTSSVARTVDVEVAADNGATVYLNGTQIATTSFPARTTVSAVLAAGLNQFTALAANTTGALPNPAGFIMSVTDAVSGAVLFRTTDAGGWWASTSEPAGWPSP